MHVCVDPLLFEFFKLRIRPKDNGLKKPINRCWPHKCKKEKQALYFSNQLCIILFVHSMDISSDEDKRTLTMIDPGCGDDDVSQAPAEASVAGAEMQQQYGDIRQRETSKSVEKNPAKILQKLKPAFQQLTSPDNLEAYLALHSQMRVIVSIEQLFALSAEKCTVCG